MANAMLLKDAGLKDGEAIHTWQYVSVGDSIRIYFKPNGDDNGFYFYVVDWCSGIDWQWDINITEVDCLYHGIAYFDGIRHLYLGHEETNNQGYCYYPTIQDHILVFNTLIELEAKYCPQK